MIESWIDIPNLQTVDLPDSFQRVKSKSITRICMNMNEWIDVSPILADLFRLTLVDIDTNSKLIQIPDGSYNNVRILNYSQYTLLEELIIGDDCFVNVNEFMIDGLNELKSVKIGKNSFTNIKSNDYWDYNKANNPNRSFSVLNCIELESIEIGEYSFSDYGGGFELKNLPKLESIKIGEIGSRSFNFYFSSFVVQGIINLYSANE